MKMQSRARWQILVLLGVLLTPGIFLPGCGSSSSGGGNPGNAVAPTITSQPTNANVNVGQPAMFSVTAIGTAPLTYAWTSNGMAVGTNSNTYAIAQTTAAENGAQIQVTVSNTAGSKASNIVALTVNAAGVAPTITTQPTNMTVNVGLPVTFTVVATGTAPLTYAWTQNGAAVGTNSNTYTIAQTTSAENGAHIQVTVSNAEGNKQSNIVTLTVKTPAGGNVNVLTFRNDVGRTGQNLNETILTTSSVNFNTFGKLGFLSADGLVDGAPLYVADLTIAGASHNVAYVVSENDSVYAYDADNFTQLWKVTVLGANETPSDDRGCSQVSPQIGITSTPVIDLNHGAHGTIFVVAMSKDNSGNYHQRLHALDLTTGAEESGSPTEISASFSSQGVNSTFDPKQYKERVGLLLLNGAIYMGWASHCDDEPYQGWLMGYSESTLQQVSVLNLTPHDSRGEGGIWMAGAGLAADSSGNIYFLDANGTFDDTLDANGFPVNGDFGNGFLKVSTSGNALAVADYFNMHNTDAESNADQDLGSGGAMVLPDIKDNIGNTWHLAVGAGKDSHIYVVNRDNMGKFNTNNDNAIYQEISSNGLGGGVFASPAYFNNTVYYGAVGDNLKAFSISNAKLVTPASSQTAITFGYPGTTPSISANGTSNAIVWAVEAGGRGTLHAYDATNLANELYNSNQAANGRDQFSDNKFIAPTIANGKVFVGTPTGVIVFGLLP
jgi:hypothetical protein